MRVIPLLINHYKLNNAVPQDMALGFAAFLRFMKVELVGEGKYSGTINNKDYIVTDASADFFYKAWANENINAVVEQVLKNKELWEVDLTVFPGFKVAVVDQLNGILANDQIEMNAGNKKL